jgi:hypothetical protein
MFDLFGAEMPLAVRFFLAFLIVLGLIGAAAWAVRRFGSARIGGAVRGRQPRLAVIDYATVDSRRRLILVRRDNIEHLVMIGGPTDVVVEANIVRAAPAAGLARPPAPGEILARGPALPELAQNGSWPLQPEPPATPPRRSPRPEPAAEETISSAPIAPSEPPPRPQRDVLSAIADDLAATSPITAAPPMAAPVTAMPPPRSRPAPVPRPQPPEPRAPVQPALAETAESADQSLAEMAQRLEAALRKPKTVVPEPAEDVEASAPPPPPPPRAVARPADARPVRAEAKPKEGKALYDTLEQEMASLLGRPPGKP